MRPLCVATTSEGAYLASDVLALLPMTRDVVFLEDGDVAELTTGKIVITGQDGQPLERASHRIDWDAEASDMGGATRTSC